MKSILKQMLFASLVFFAASANAILVVQISDTSNFSGTTITAIDTDGDGFVNINSALGGWNFNVVSGFGAPALGGPNLDEMDLNSVNVSGGTGTIYMRLTDTGFSRLNTSFNTTFGGTTDGSVSFQSYVDATNAAFGQGTLLSNSGIISAGAFSGFDNGAINMAGLYSLSIYAAITHGAGFNVSSFDYNVKIPEPMTIALFGLGLLGLVASRRTKA